MLGEVKAPVQSAQLKMVAQNLHPGGLSYKAPSGGVKYA